MWKMEKVPGAETQDCNGVGGTKQITVEAIVSLFQWTGGIGQLCIGFLRHAVSSTDF